MGDPDVRERVFEFEEKYGTEDFIKTGCSALNRLLVEKGIITAEELQESMLKEMESFEKRHPEPAV